MKYILSILFLICVVKIDAQTGHDQVAIGYNALDAPPACVHEDVKPNTTRFDTAKIIMLASKDNGTNSGVTFWLKGYEVTKIIEKSVYGEYGNGYMSCWTYRRQKTTTHENYLDANKNKIDSTIVVWQIR